MLHSVVIVHHEVGLAEDIFSSSLLFRQIIGLNSNAQLFMLLSCAFHTFELFLVVQIQFKTVLSLFNFFFVCSFGRVGLGSGRADYYFFVSLPLLGIQKFFLYLFSPCTLSM